MYIISFTTIYLFYINWSVVINIEFCNIYDFEIEKFHVLPTVDYMNVNKQTNKFTRKYQPNTSHTTNTNKHAPHTQCIFQTKTTHTNILDTHTTQNTQKTQTKQTTTKTHPHTSNKTHTQNIHTTNTKQTHTHTHNTQTPKKTQKTDKHLNTKTHTV